MTPMLTTEQVAARLKVDEETVRRMARRGDLPAIRIGGRLRFDPDELAAALERNRVAPAQPRARASRSPRVAPPQPVRLPAGGSVRDRLRARRGG